MGRSYNSNNINNNYHHHRNKETNHSKQPLQQHVTVVQSNCEDLHRLSVRQQPRCRTQQQTVANQCQPHHLHQVTMATNVLLRTPTHLLLNQHSSAVMNNHWTRLAPDWRTLPAISSTCTEHTHRHIHTHIHQCHSFTSNHGITHIHTPLNGQTLTERGLALNSGSDWCGQILTHWTSLFHFFTDSLILDLQRQDPPTSRSLNIVF